MTLSDITCISNPDSNVCSPLYTRTRIMERDGNNGGAVSVVNETSDGSLDDFYESGEGASMLLFEFILHGIFTNLG